MDTKRNSMTLDSSPPGDSAEYVGATIPITIKCESCEGEMCDGMVQYLCEVCEKPCCSECGDTCGEKNPVCDDCLDAGYEDGYRQSRDS